MQALKVIDLVAPEFQRRGLPPPVLIQRGSFSTPSALEIDVNGKRSISQFWEGSYPDEVLAKHIILDALCVLWNLSPKEAEARADHERSQARR